MSFLIAQGSATLYKMNLSTGVATTLTLPTGITLSTTRKPKFAVLNQWIVITNSPTKNLVIDPEGVVKVLVPEAPVNGPTTAAGSGSGLTGTYKYRVSFIVKNSDGELLMESPLSPISVDLAVTATDIALSDLPLSNDDITGRRLYRSLSGGAIFFHLMDIDDNTTQTINDNLADASLGLLPAQSIDLRTPPGTMPGIRLKNIVEWKSRLWAVADDPVLVDTLFFTETNKVYAWTNSLIAHPTGQETNGIVGLVPRRNNLGVVKKNGVWQVSGSSGSTGIATTQINVSRLSVGKGGSSAPDTVIVINDTAYWLGDDGVYEWSDDGIKSITDDSVAPWFQTDTYFNRSRFPNAFAKYNESRKSYDLHLSLAAGSTENRWVSFNLLSRKWYGPHLTSAFTPTHAAHLQDSNGLPIALVGGSDGVVYQANAAAFTDGASTAIDFDCYGPLHNESMPDFHKFWGRLVMETKIEASGTLSIIPYVGRLNAAAGTTLSHDLTTGRETLPRLGVGPMCRLRFRQNTNAVGTTIYGYEVTPISLLGRR